MAQLHTEGVHVAPWDVVIIIAYLVLILVVGALLSRRASKDLDSYFLGGRQLPWWLLGLSGTACYFDVAGVMWSIALFYVMGQQFYWPQFMWGHVAMLACFATFMGKWLRRSHVLTGAEWMVIRFGNGPSGQFARSAYAMMAVVIAVAFVGFAEYGCGTFLSIFIPKPSFASAGWIGENWRHVLAIALMALTAIYTVSSGLIGVGFIGFIQFIIMLLGSATLIFMAVDMSSYDQIAKEVPTEWLRVSPDWRWDRLAEWDITAGWVLLIPVAFTWVIKGVALGVGGPQQLYDLQRFLAARSPREASLAGMIWGVGLTPMYMVAAAVGAIGIAKWGGDLSNPEELYPVVIGTMLPAGLKGLVLAGLMSAFMSTFSATVNAGASYLTHDLYQRYVSPNASDRQLVAASRLCSIVVIVAGILVGMTARDINVIFEWIMMVLGTGVLMPNVLRWFWWRFNGTGFAVGTLVGVAAAILCVLIFPDAESYITFPILLAISLISSLVATYASPPTDMEVLKEFYRRIQPAGAWGPVRRAVAADGYDAVRDAFLWDGVSALITAIGLQALYLISTYAVTHQWTELCTATAVVALCACALYFTWYRRLAPE